VVAQEVVEQVFGRAPVSAYDLGHFPVAASGTPWPVRVVRLIDRRTGAVVDVWLRGDRWGYMPTTWKPQPARTGVGHTHARRTH